MFIYTCEVYLQAKMLLWYEILYIVVVGGLDAYKNIANYEINKIEERYFYTLYVYSCIMKEEFMKYIK